MNDRTPPAAPHLRASGMVNALHGLADNGIDRSDPEIVALAATMAALGRLTDGERARVLAYLNGRYGDDREGPA